MNFSFFNLFRKNKNKISNNIKDMSEVNTMENISSSNESTTVDINSYKEDIIEPIRTEKDLLFQKIKDEDLNFLYFRYGLDKESISLNFLKKLVNEPSVLSYIKTKFIEDNIIKKINDNALRVSDIKSYDKELFQYNIFSSEDNNILEILRKNIVLSDKRYASFSLEDYQKYINASDYIDVTISSFFTQNELVTEKKKAIPLKNVSISSNDSIEVIQAIDQNKIFSHNIFDNYYSGDISFNEDCIIFISYNLFLDWIKENEKLEILKKNQVVIKDDFIFCWEIEKNIKYYSNMFYDNVNNDSSKIDNLLIKVNHLLYILDNSDLDKITKEYYRYYISKNFDGEIPDWQRYFIENTLEEIACEIQQRIDEQDISLLTEKFNQLDIIEKQKSIKPINFSVNIFLNQFNNLDNLSSFEFFNYVCRLNDDEKNKVLSSQLVINKLQGLLKESANDEYKDYKKIVENLSIADFFKIFDSEFISKYYQENEEQNEYRLFYTLLEKDVNKVVKYILNDDAYFKEFVQEDIGRYGFQKLEYPILLNLLRKIEQSNLNVDLSFLRTTDEVMQFKLLKEQFSDDFLIKIVTNTNKEVQQFFYLEDKRFNYLYDKFNIMDLVNKKYKIPEDIIYKNDFLDRFKSNSIVQFRANVNNFSIYQPNFFFEDKVKQYEDELISNYDIESGMFIQYQHLLSNIQILDNNKFIHPGIDFFYDANTNYECRQFIHYDDNDKICLEAEKKLIEHLKKISKLKLNEIVIDRLFEDNIYNVFLNLKEMLRFHKGLDDNQKVLSPEQIDFYETILKFDQLDGKQIMEWYQKLKDKNVALMFYQDLQKVKSKSYDMIKENLFQPEQMKGLKDKDKSLQYGVDVFDLRDKEYTILARCMNSRNSDLYRNRRDCYTLLSNENSSVFHKDAYIYGYSGFDNDCVLHIFEGDSFSSDSKWSELNAGANRVNRIMTDREIVTNSYWYSEVQIVNKKSREKEGLFETLRPSFLIVYDKINEKVLEEAKNKNIPICVISQRNLDMRLDGKISLDKKLDEYIIEYGISPFDEIERRKNR